MNVQSATVFVVDDDPSVRRALARLLRAGGYETRSFGSAQSFLTDQDIQTPGCLLLDIAMPELNGIELQRRLTDAAYPHPIVFLTGEGDIGTCAEAMKRGAVDFLTKPIEEARLLAAVEQALKLDRVRRVAAATHRILEQRLVSLTKRERQVLEHVVAGRLNKQIAADLGTCEKTIKVHRAHVMAKMQARSLAELVRLAGSVGDDAKSGLTPVL
jgi:FixJ family two-component response regulator